MTRSRTFRHGVLAVGAALLTSLTAGGRSHAAPPEKPAEPEKPKPAGPTCSLRTTEAPRGGRLEVEGLGFGKSPLVRIADRVTRIIERTENTIAVQIHADSNGGEVTLQVGGQRIPCGTLTIVGKNE
jgi:hypothetical protein